MNPADLILPLRRVHWDLIDILRTEMASHSADELAREAGETAGDVIYALDRAVEEPLEAALRRELAGLGTFLVVCEGLGPDERIVIPSGPEDAADAVIVIDPIDGTRGLMYGKRSAWVLTGVAPGPPAGRTLEDIVVAVQTEIPTLRSSKADQLWATRGEGAAALTRDLDSGAETPFTPTPSRADTVRGGFAAIARFFPPGRALLAAIDDEVMLRVLGPDARRAPVFEDQYLSTAGQLHQLMTGRDRMVADLRPLVFEHLERTGRLRGHDGHPYDLCTALIAREAGVIVTSATGGDLDFPIDTTTPVGWIGYANEAVRDEIEAVLEGVIAEILAS